MDVHKLAGVLAILLVVFFVFGADRISRLRPFLIASNVGTGEIEGVAVPHSNVGITDVSIIWR